VLHVPALPREPTGKLSATQFSAWAAQRAAAQRPARG
jgi:hypothetical protein